MEDAFVILRQLFFYHISDPFMHPIFFSRWNFQSVEKSNITFHKKEGIPITESWKYVPYGSVRKLLDLEFYYTVKKCAFTQYGTRYLTY